MTVLLFVLQIRARALGQNEVDVTKLRTTVYFQLIVSHSHLPGQQRSSHCRECTPKSNSSGLPLHETLSCSKRASQTPRPLPYEAGRYGTRPTRDPPYCRETWRAPDKTSTFVSVRNPRWWVYFNVTRSLSYCP